MKILTEQKTSARWIAICEGPVETASVEAFARDERAGAVAVFVGTTRRFTNGLETVSLEYDAYNEMAIATFGGLLDDAFVRWPICKAGVVHAFGSVGLLEASVCVAVSTPHRADSFEAARFLIDRLKEEAAIWKKEKYADGSDEWVTPDPDNQ